MRGVPRVPWEAEGIFDGISEYKLDRKGKIYEHKLTNVQMRDPPLARSPLSIGLNLIPIPRLQGAPQVLLTCCPVMSLVQHRMAHRVAFITTANCALPSATPD